MSVSASEVEAALRGALAPESLAVVDDSARHAGHAGAREGRHFSVAICSARFEGLTRVARHRLVYDALQSLMPRGIHAVAIDARAPGPL
jgi:BolA protein